MGCNCRNSTDNGAHQIGGLAIASLGGRTDGLAGTYVLANYPDCGEAYTGKDFGVYVVARGRADVERLFHDDDSQDAYLYGVEVKGSLIRVPARSLCDAAVRDFLTGQFGQQ